MNPKDWLQYEPIVLDLVILIVRCLQNICTSDTYVLTRYELLRI